MSIDVVVGAEDMYFSVDVETDGPVPGAHSMLSIGVVALGRDLRPVGTFYRRLVPLQGAVLSLIHI